MAKFHPNDNTLIEYSAGNLPWALSICVSSHLEYCPQCKNRVSEFNALGGSLLETSSAAEATIDSGSFEALMDRIRSAPAEADSAISDASEKVSVSPTLTKATAHLPKVVRKLVPADRPLKWKRVSPSLREAHLKTGQDEYEVCFHKIKRGGRVVEHDHGGTEVTVVLEGSFSDERGTYSVGDYIEKQPGDIHRPMATQDQDCLCLSVVEAPVRLTGMMGRIINPFLSFNPS